MPFYKIYPDVDNPEIFSNLLEYIETSAFYQGDRANCGIEVASEIVADKEIPVIYLKHRLEVIQALFPQLRSIIAFPFRKSFSENHLIGRNAYLCKVRFALMSDVLSITRAQNSLIDQAKSFFNSPEFAQSMGQNLSGKNLPASTTSAKDLIVELVNRNDVVTIGEVHEDGASKKLLIDNMQALQAQGVDTIFLEHVPDTMRDALEDYFNSASLELPLSLKEFLNYQDALRSTFLKPGALEVYNFTNLVIQAKRYGIKVVPFDTRVSYETGSMVTDADHQNRMYMMNYLAHQEYVAYKSKNPQGKCLFFVGSGHVNSVVYAVPGIAEITGSPTLVVQDNDSDERIETQLGVAHIVKPDFLIELNPLEKSAELEALIEDIANGNPPKVSGVINTTRIRTMQNSSRAVAEFVPDKQVSPSDSDEGDFLDLSLSDDGLNRIERIERVPDTHNTDLSESDEVLNNSSNTLHISNNFFLQIIEHRATKYVAAVLLVGGLVALGIATFGTFNLGLLIAGVVMSATGASLLTPAVCFFKSKESCSNKDVENAFVDGMENMKA